MSVLTVYAYGISHTRMGKIRILDRTWIKDVLNKKITSRMLLLCSLITLLWLKPQVKLNSLMLHACGFIKVDAFALLDARMVFYIFVGGSRTLPGHLPANRKAPGAQLGLSVAVVSLGKKLYSPIASATQLLNRENIVYIVAQLKSSCISWCCHPKSQLKINKNWYNNNDVLNIYIYIYI